MSRPSIKVVNPGTGLREKVGGVGAAASPVYSVNGQTGAVVLDAADVGAADATTTSDALATKVAGNGITDIVVVDFGMIPEPPDANTLYFEREEA